MGIDSYNGPWDDDETRILVEAYLSMLDSELTGKPYSKTEHNRRVQEGTGRSKGSIEFKFCNISHVLWEHGQPFVNGYKPRSHVQESLRGAVWKRLGIEGDVPPARSDSRAVAAERDYFPSEGTMVVEAVDEVGKTESPYSIFGGFWDRATGGTDVAARPDHTWKASGP